MSRREPVARERGQVPTRRVYFLLSAWALAALIAFAASGSSGFALAAQRVNRPQLGRSVHGVVLDARARPLSSAIVYLKNRRTKVIHTAIADTNGAYSFHQLDANVGYDLYAEWKGRRSSVRTDSEYETATDIELDLTIPVE